MKIRYSERLSYRQAKISVLIAFLLGMSLSALQIGYDLFKERKQVDKTVCQILEMLRQTAVQSVYTVDSSMADTVVNGFFEYRPIRIAKIIDESGEQAMTRIDMRLADKVKEDIRAYNKLLADELASLIGDYEYDKILNLLAEAKQIREQMMDEQ